MVHSWTVDELNRILGSARTMPGHVAGIPAGDWWTGFLLILLDTRCPLHELLLAAPQDLDERRGSLAVGSFVHELHPLAFQAAQRVKFLGQIVPGQSRLFPWPLDAAALGPLAQRYDRRRGLRRKPLYMLLRQYKALLWRADLPYASQHLFERLRQTLVSLDRINAPLAFVPRPGRPSFPRAIGRQRAQHRALRAPKKGSAPVARLKSPPVAGSLLEFVESKYIPLRLEGASKDYISNTRSVSRSFGAHLGRVAMLGDLTDDNVEAWMAARLRIGRTPKTVNGDMAVLLAIWRYAYRKRAIEVLPRSVERVREPKRVPIAWSLEELTKIVQTCARLEGTLADTLGPRQKHQEGASLPSALWWTSLVLLIYETGLRYGAVQKLHLSHFHLTTRVLTVPAEFQKHYSEQRFVLHADTVALLERMRTKREMLFPCAARLQWVWRTYKAILAAAGLPATRRDMFHKLRRTSGTCLEDVAGEAAAVRHLGHSSPHLYRQFYRDPTKLRTASASDLLPRPTY